MSKVLVVRFSALGDVAMTVPIIYSVACKYPHHEFYVLTRKGWSIMFGEVPSNVRFIEADLKDKHKGLKGINKLCQELKAEGFDFVADLHDVLRSKYIRLRLWLSGCKTAHIDKGRKGKKQLTRKNKKVFVQQKTSFERYMGVFEKLGLSAENNFTSVFSQNNATVEELNNQWGEKGTDKWIGIAAFAKHKGKIYPKEKMEEVISRLSDIEGVRLFFFGGGKDEEEITKDWESRYKHTTSVVGKVNMMSELALISKLDVMISMDSANMHLASLVATPVVSIWGATHTFAGFLGWGQKKDRCVEVDLYCRPCSVFGDKNCHRGDYACMNRIDINEILSKVSLVANQEEIKS